MDLSFFSEETLLLPSLEELFDSNGAVSVCFEPENVGEDTLENLLNPVEEQRQLVPIPETFFASDSVFASTTTPDTFSCEPSPNDVLSAEEIEISYEPEVHSNKRIKLENGTASYPQFPTSVHLSRKIMLEISSDDYENHIKRIRLTRRLTEEEELVHKEQRRLVRNREAASFSRAKKKTQIEQLTEEATKLDDERNTLEKQIDRVSVENTWLVNEIQFLSRLVEQSPALTTAFKVFRSKVDIGEVVVKEPTSNKRQRTFEEPVKQLKVVPTTAA